MDRWFLLDTSLSPRELTRPQEFDNLAPPPSQTEVPVFALALVLGEEGKREWLVYAHAPKGARTGVTISLPGFGDLTADVPQSGCFYHVKEEGRQVTPLVTHDGATGYYTGVVFPLTNYPTVSPPSGYPTGSLAFWAGNYTTMEEMVQVIQQPVAPAFYLTGSSNLVTSNDIWQCAGSLAAGGAAQQNVGKMIAAAFNRGMIVNGGTVTTSLDDTTCSADAGSFYSAGTTFNPWAQTFHLVAENGLAYGFPYDDVCDQSTDIPPSGDSLVAAFIRMTLGKFHD